MVDCFNDRHTSGHCFVWNLVFEVKMTPYQEWQNLLGILVGYFVVFYLPQLLTAGTFSKPKTEAWNRYQKCVDKYGKDTPESQFAFDEFLNTKEHSDFWAIGRFFCVFTLSILLQYWWRSL